MPMKHTRMHNDQEKRSITSPDGPDVPLRKRHLGDQDLLPHHAPLAQECGSGFCTMSSAGGSNSSAERVPDREHGSGHEGEEPLLSNQEEVRIPLHQDYGIFRLRLSKRRKAGRGGGGAGEKAATISRHDHDGQATCPVVGGNMRYRGGMKRDESVVR